MNLRLREEDVDKEGRGDDDLVGGAFCVRGGKSRAHVKKNELYLGMNE